MNTKPIYRLPILEDTQVWACDGGCEVVEPKLHRNVYRQDWDAKGTLLEQKAEHYYTCQQGHLLTVWDKEKRAYVALPDHAYQVPINEFGLSLHDIEQFLAELNEDTMEYRTDKNMPNAKITGVVITTPKGETVSISISYLNEIRAQLSVCPIA